MSQGDHATFSQLGQPFSAFYPYALRGIESCLTGSTVIVLCPHAVLVKYGGSSRWGLYRVDDGKLPRDCFWTLVDIADIAVGGWKA